MKLRHAATLALTGWYLMVPPVHEISSPSRDSRGELVFRLSADISEWQIDSKHKTLAICEAVRRKELQTDDHFARRRAALGKCIASDDPSLKETK